jgi:cardiolipin synthase
MWTTPNILTISRIAAAPAVAFMVAFGGPGWALPAFLLFGAAALTDFLDGWLARKLGQTTSIGKMLDPIGDKVMVALLLLAIASKTGDEWSFMVPAVVILTREILVSGLREYLGDVKLNVTKLAKWKTTAQLIAISVLLGADLAPAFKGGIEIFIAGLILLWIAAALTAITGWDYFAKGLAVIHQQERGE